VDVLVSITSRCFCSLDGTAVCPVVVPIFSMALGHNNGKLIVRHCSAFFIVMTGAAASLF